MDTSILRHDLRSRNPRDRLRDPAFWAWLVVALLAILPVHAALAGG
jgi:hypothetical protein